MDPLSITASCIGITAGIATLTERITAFVSSVREARKDLDAVRRELGSLQLSLSALSGEDERFGFDKTPQLKENLLGVLGNCGGIVEEIRLDLEGMEGEDGKLGMSKKLKWATSGKAQMAKLRLGLEAHKSALDIALDLIAISITADIKQDTSALREDTEKIREDTDQILQEIGNLQTQVAQLDVSHDRSFMMKRFLESSVTYAESVANLDEFGSEPEVEVLDAVPEEPPTHLMEAPARSEAPPSKSVQSLPSAALSPFDRVEHASSSGSRSPNRYWSSLPQNERDALLFDAASQGNAKRISLLLDCGANIDARNELGETPLSFVIVYRYYNCLQLLLDNGARTDKIGSRPEDRHAFLKANHLGDIKSMKMILESGPENVEFQRLYSQWWKSLGSNSRVQLDNSEPRTFFETNPAEDPADSFGRQEGSVDIPPLGLFRLERTAKRDNKVPSDAPHQQTESTGVSDPKSRLQAPFPTTFEKDSELKNQSDGLTPISFQASVNRAKTKKWVTVNPANYGGDDWGDDDDEYEAYDVPAPPIPNPTGLRQQGHITQNPPKTDSLTSNNYKKDNDGKSNLSRIGSFREWTWATEDGQRACVRAKYISLQDGVVYLEKERDAREGHNIPTSISVPFQRLSYLDKGLIGAAHMKPPPPPPTRLTRNSEGQITGYGTLAHTKLNIEEEEMKLKIKAEEVKQNLKEEEMKLKIEEEKMKQKNTEADFARIAAGLNGGAFARLKAKLGPERWKQQPPHLEHSALPAANLSAKEAAAAVYYGNTGSSLKSGANDEPKPFVPMPTARNRGANLSSQSTPQPRNTLAGGGRPTPPTWADFLASGFGERPENGPPPVLLPPDKLLPPIDGRATKGEQDPYEQTGRRANLARATPENPFGF